MIFFLCVCVNCQVPNISNKIWASCVIHNFQTRLSDGIPHHDVTQALTTPPAIRRQDALSAVKHLTPMLKQQHEMLYIQWIWPYMYGNIYIYIFCILTILYIYIFYACSCANQFIYQVCVQHWNRFAVNPDPIFRESHQLSFEDHHFPPCPSHQLSSFPCSNSSKAKDRKARKWPEWHLTSNQHPNVLVGF